MQNLTKREIVQEIYKAKEECRRGDILQNAAIFCKTM